MHDIRLIRENPQAFDAALAKRGLEPLAAHLLEADEVRRAAATSLQEAQNRRNEASKLIGQAMAKGDKETALAKLSETVSLIDKLVGKGIIHDNAAGRYKSRLMKRINRVGAPAAATK